MFDPLHSTAAVFGGADEANTPPWPTTPHSIGSPVPNLRRASPVPPTPDKGPAPGLYGREPQIYGQPESGLISPRDTVGSNGTKYEKTEPYLRVRINGLDRNRRDILVKLDAQVCCYSICCGLCFNRFTLDEPFQFQRVDVPQCVAVVPGVPAILRGDCQQQPPDDCTRSSACSDIRTDRRRRRQTGEDYAAAVDYTCLRRPDSVAR